MIHEHQSIIIDKNDILELDSVGIDADDIQLLIHDLAADFRTREKKNLTKVIPSGLTKAEMDILAEGGASGIYDDDDNDHSRTRGLAVLALEVELRKVEKESLTGPDVARVLDISFPRVRQLVAPSNKGLYFFLNNDGKQRFPSWQINEKKLIPHIKELLRALSKDVHPVTVSRFMTSVNPDLESPVLHRCLTPKEWLVTGHQPHSVLELARDL